MSQHRIVFLDDDHVIRLGRYALARPPEVNDDWVRAFFSPEPVDPQAVYDAASGLHESDGVSLLGLSATPAEISHANPTIIIFRRGTVDAGRIAACPKLRLIQRLGERSDGIDLAAAASRGIHVSCLPRLTLIYTAEHAIMMMLALAKKLVPADAQIRAGQWDKNRVRATDAVAYNWTGYASLSGLHGKTLGIIGLGEVGSIMARIAHGFGMRVIYFNRLDAGLVGFDAGEGRRLDAGRGLQDEAQALVAVDFVVAGRRLGLGVDILADEARVADLWMQTRRKAPSVNSTTTR